jgi:diacylglycerol kinase (ATP)
VSRPVFIVNPAAGAGRAGRAVPALHKALESRHAEVVLTQRPGQASDLARKAAQDGYTPVVGVGGDGTLQEIVNGLVSDSTAATMAVVPVGTGNDFARCVGLPSDLREAVNLVYNGTPRTMDLGQCGQRVFVNGGGVGFDARVAIAAANMPQALRRGTLPYVLAVLREVVGDASSVLTLHLDDQVIEQCALMVAVANGRFYGGGMMICPEAVRTDGLLDVCVVGDLSRLEVLGLLPKLFSGGHVGHPKVRFYRSRVVRIEGPPGTFVQTDGEIQGNLPAEFTAVPAAIRIMTPSATASEGS